MYEHLFSVCRYVDRLAEKLKKILSDSEKMISLSRLMVTRREEARLEEVDTEPKVDLIRSRTMELKGQVSAQGRDGWVKA